MATVAEIQAQLDPQGTKKKILILRQHKATPAATTDLWYCTGGQVTPRARWVTSTNTDTAAQQATSITSGMTA